MSSTDDKTDIKVEDVSEPMEFDKVWVKIEIEDKEYEPNNFSDRESDDGFTYPEAPQDSPGFMPEEEVKDKKPRNQKKPSKLFSCEHCDYTTVYSNGFKAHVRKHNPSERIKCPHCDFTTIYSTSLPRHIQSMHEQSDDLYLCDKCDYTTKDKYYLIAHSRKHEAKKFKCTQCNYSTSYKQHLKKHFKSHLHTNEVYKCDKCPFATKSETFIVKHLAHSHNELCDVAKKCEHCDFVTKVKWRLNIHTKKSKKFGLLKCDRCEYQTEFRCAFRKHKTKVCMTSSCMKITNSPKKYTYNNLDEQRPINIPLEAYEMIDTTQSMIHPFLNDSTGNMSMKSEEQASTTNPRKSETSFRLKDIAVMASDDPEKPFQCPMCPHRAKYKSSVQVHYQRHHTGNLFRPFQCHNCDFNTKTNDQLRLHMKRSRSNTEVKCPTCGFTAMHKCTIVLHQKSHHRFRCTYCSYSTKSKYDMQRHYEQKHVGNLSKCRFCDYTALRKESVSVHEFIHTGDKPFKCTQCEYMSVQKYLLDKHIKNNHTTPAEPVPTKCDIEMLRVSKDLLKEEEDVKQKYDPDTQQRVD